MARRLEYLQGKIRKSKCSENTFCISCLAVKRTYDHGCLQTPWKEAFENAFSGVSILNYAFVEHCWDQASQTAGPEAVNQKNLALSERKARQEELRMEARQNGIVFNVANAQDTSRSLDNIKVPIAKKDNDKMIDCYAITLKRLQWLKHSDIPMAMTLSNGSTSVCIFCIFCYKLHQIDSEECTAKENQREALEQLHEKPTGIPMLNEKVDSPQEEKPKTEESVTDADFINVFHWMHMSLILQTREIEMDKENSCFQCFHPTRKECQCPKDKNTLALTKAARKLCDIVRDIPTIDGVLKNSTAANLMWSLSESSRKDYPHRI